ncbi:uncharacterized protein LOC133874383 [Alnus glutinosa]|uniref:uncharacterized protein LOC133874383 n=1 Tax=Alnus glutinosa TaxID=3517 RepID=UPI002D76896E|nr:uncharacterized protein LOC133874383 [Alnus glutinosa]
MELKSTITTIFFLFLLLSLPYFSTGGSEVDLEVYQIDYRGPETHSSTPPPDHSHGKPLIHRKSSLAPRKSKGSRGTGNIGEKAKKIHG